MSQETPKQRSVSEIETELLEVRQRLAGNIEGLIEQAHPKAVVNQAVDQVKVKADEVRSKAREVIDSAKGKADAAFGSTREKLGPSIDRLSPATAKAGDVFGSAREKCQGWCQTVKSRLTDEDGRLNDLGVKVLVGVGGVAVLLAGVAWRKDR